MAGGGDFTVEGFDRDKVALFLPEATTTSEYPNAMLSYPIEAQVIPEPHCLSNATDDIFAGNLDKDKGYFPQKVTYS